MTVLRIIILTILVFTHVIAAAATLDQALEALIKQQNFLEAKEFIEKKLNASQNLTSDEFSYYYNKYSHIEFVSGNFENALAWGKKSEKHLSENSSLSLFGESYRNICFSFIRLGKLDSALIYAEKLYEFSKRENDLTVRRSALMAMGNISLQNRKYENSLAFYKEALESSQKSGDTLNLKVDLYNVGLAYNTLKDFESGIEYLEKAAIRAEAEGEKRLLATIYGTLADNYLETNNEAQQFFYLNKANELAKAIGNQPLLAMGYSNLMQYHMRKNEFGEAIKLGKQAQSILEIKPNIQLGAKVDSIMYISYKVLKDSENALLYLEKYDKIKDQIRSETQRQKLEELTLGFEVERKNLQIESQEAELKAKKTKIRLLLVALMVSLMLIASGIYIYFKNAKTRQIFFQKEKEIDFQMEKNKLRNQSNKIYSQPQEPENLITEVEEQKIKLKNIFLEIVDQIEQQKLYLDPELNQKSLANLLGTNRQYLYEAINQGGEENFRGLINRLRINEAKKIIEDSVKSGNKINYAIINNLVGFKAFSTYYRAFKGLTGLTPNEYAEEFRKTNDYL